MRILRRTTLAAGSALLTLSLVACGDDADDADQTSTTAESSPSEAATPGGTGTSSPGTDTADGAADVVEAVRAAEDEAGGTAYEVEREDGDGWEVDVAVDDARVEVRTDADGAVTGSRDDGSVDSDDQEALAAATTTIAQAVDAALAEAQGQVTDVSLDRERGTFVWEVTVEDRGTETEVHVDVATGDVVGTDQDD